MVMIVFMGVAGAGKSVQGKMLAKKLGYKWLSTGELLRQNVTDKRKAEMLTGKLLDDGEIISIISRCLESKKSESRKIVLDGFPRTLVQAEWLIAKHLRKEIEISAVIHLEASKEVVLQRLLRRGRPDDTEKAISLRFVEYEEQTLPIVDWFKSKNVDVYEVDAEDSVGKIHQKILNSLK